MDEVIVKFKGRVIFRQYIPKKRKRFSIKIYKLCDESGYMYDMRVYLGRDSYSTTDDMTATHATVRHLTSTVEGLGHKIFMDTSFRPQDFLMIWTAQQKRHDFGPKQLKLKWGDVRVRTWGGYVETSDHMANSYSMSRCTFKWTMKLFFHLLDLTVLNSWMLLSSCGAKYTH